MGESCLLVPIGAAINWTAVIAAGITGVTAVVVGLIALLSTHLTSGVSRFQTESEERREEAKRQEAERRLRQDAYVRLLSHEQRLDLLCTSSELVTRESFDAWLRDFAEATNTVLVLGTREVADAVDRYLTILLPPLWKAIDDARTVEEFDHLLRHAWGTSHTKDDFNALLDAIREDVAADRERLGFELGSPDAAKSASTVASRPRAGPEAG